MLLLLWFDGRKEGRDVSNVGIMVGIAVNWEDGTDVGVSVGISVNKEGADVKVVVGVSVNCKDGAKVGESVGGIISTNTLTLSSDVK